MIAALALLAIIAHFVLRNQLPAESAFRGVRTADWPLLLALLLGGGAQVFELAGKLWRREFSSDLLAGISICTALSLGELLAGTLVVLMLAGGQALEAFAVRSASSVLDAQARRMPSVAHRRSDGQLLDVPLSQVAVADVLQIFPHEYCPVDGTVVDGHGAMDESYLTGEPYWISKAPGAAVSSGAINGDTALTIRADRLPVDSRYERIMRVMRESEQQRPRMRRLADQLGAYYTPLALALAGAAWLASQSPTRFLAVLVVATPCPLLIAIPVTIIGAISLSARRGIIIKDPAVLESVNRCRTAIFDKTGTLTYGEARVSEVLPAAGVDADTLLRLVASLERYSTHPLSEAVQREAERRKLALSEAAHVSERPGAGLSGAVEGMEIQITSRRKLLAAQPALAGVLPPQGSGLECMATFGGAYAGTLRFHDEPRSDGASFVRHLAPRHHFDRVLLVSGDRESEVRYLAEKVGIDEVYFSQSPEQKLELVRQAMGQAPTVFMGDGINDAPALTAATVGIAFGAASEITSEAAGAVILESSLQRVDEFLHISRRMLTIALQSAVGGMGASVVAMLLAAFGYLSPVAGAVTQEVIDVIAVLNSLRMAVPPRALSDVDATEATSAGD